MIIKVQNGRTDGEIDEGKNGRLHNIDPDNRQQCAICWIKCVRAFDK